MYDNSRIPVRLFSPDPECHVPIRRGGSKMRLPGGGRGTGSKWGVITDYFFLEALLRVSLRTTSFPLSAPTEPEPRPLQVSTRIMHAKCARGYWLSRATPEIERGIRWGDTAHPMSDSNWYTHQNEPMQSLGGALGARSTVVHVEGEVRYRQGVITDYFFLEALLQVSLRTTTF